MAKTKQFTVSIDNHPGAVAEIARTLGSAKVNILSLLGTSQGTGGRVQLFVDDARRAKKALDAARVSYQETPAEQFELPNKPGALAQVLGKRAGAMSSLVYLQVAPVKGTFHDITNGNNGSFAAGPGWDACTGWGTPIGSAITAALAGKAAAAKP